MSSPPGLLVVLALWTAVGIFALTLVLFGVILAIRISHRRRAEWRARVRARWREIFTRAIVEVPDSAPRMDDREAREILPQWSYYQELVRGECRENLARVARLAGLDLQAKRMARSGNTRDRLVAIQALGNLREGEYRRFLWPLARCQNPYESIAAAHALLRISPRETIEPLIQLIGSRPDWPPARVMAMLQEAGSDIVSEPLARATVEADDAYKPILVVYLETASGHVALRTIKEVLLGCTDHQVIATCLYRLRSIVHPDSLAIFRKYVTSPDWILQLHAVSGLGRLGTTEDVDDLVQMLRHKRFWVRYRAAQALTRLPSVGHERLQRILEDQDDRFARDILEQVIDERVAA